MKPLDFVINIALPVVILITLSDASRLGPLRALLLSVAIPFGFGLWEILRSRVLQPASVMGVVGVLLTGVIGIFDLDSAWFPVKEAAVPFGFAILLLMTDRANVPIARLLPEMLIRRDRLRAGLDARQAHAGYRSLLTGISRRWALMLAMSGTLKFSLSGVIVTAETNTPAFNRQIAFYELAQLPTTFLLMGIMMLALIGWIGQRASSLTGLPPRELYHGGEKLARLLERARALLRRGALVGRR